MTPLYYALISLFGLAAAVAVLNSRGAFDPRQGKHMADDARALDELEPELDDWTDDDLRELADEYDPDSPFPNMCAGCRDGSHCQGGASFCECGYCDDTLARQYAPYYPEPGDTTTLEPLPVLGARAVPDVAVSVWQPSLLTIPAPPRVVPQENMSVHPPYHSADHLEAHGERVTRLPGQVTRHLTYNEVEYFTVDDFLDALMFDVRRPAVAA
jgi:hypothetical protein